MKKINSKGMMQGAIALSIAAFIAKILSAVYRVPFQNMVGNTGFYVLPTGVSYLWNRHDPLH